MKEELLKTAKWRDASALGLGSHTSWMDIDETKINAQEKYDQYVTTVGFLIHETDEYIVMAATKTGDLYSDMSMIPKVLIISLQ